MVRCSVVRCGVAWPDTACCTMMWCNVKWYQVIAKWRRVLRCTAIQCNSVQYVFIDNLSWIAEPSKEHTFCHLSTMHLHSHHSRCNFFHHSRIPSPIMILDGWTNIPTQHKAYWVVTRGAGSTFSTIIMSRKGPSFRMWISFLVPRSHTGTVKPALANTSL